MTDTKVKETVKVTVKAPKKEVVLKPVKAKKPATFREPTTKLVNSNA